MRHLCFNWFRLLWLLTALAVCVNAAAPAGSKDRLRRLVRLPKLSFQFGLAFDPLRGFAMMSERFGAAKEIDQLREAMAGNGSDAARWYRLGVLFNEMGDRARGMQALNKAIELYRQQGADQSNSGKLLTGLGEALGAAGNTDEAERILRQAVKVAPKEWPGQVALGRLLALQAMSAVGPTGRPGDGQAADAGEAPKLATAQVEKAQKLGGEAMECYNRAVGLAPDQADVFAGRAVGRSTQGFLQAVFRQADGSEPDPTKLWSGMFSTEALGDLQQAARLNAGDFRVVGTAALYEVFAAGLERGMTRMEELFSGGAWSGLPDKTRLSLRAAMNRLDELAQGAEPRGAAGALEVLGILQYMVVRDLRGAEASLRRAVSLDPAREQAWEILVLMFAMSERFEDLLPVCQARLRHQDTPRNRVLVAKAFEHRNQPDKSLLEAEAAHRRYPEDFTVNLALAAALMKVSSDSATLARAGQLLGRGERILADTRQYGGAPPARDQLTNLLFLRGLHYAFNGQTDEARATFKQVLQLDQSISEAQEALQALE